MLTKTFGNFYDRVAETKIAEGQMWMKEWRDQHALDNPHVWEEVRKVEVTDYEIRRFTVAMVSAFQERMHSICSEMLWQGTHERGHAFLREIAKIALSYGVDVFDIVTQPITLPEALHNN